MADVLISMMDQVHHKVHGGRHFLRLFDHTCALLRCCRFGHYLWADVLISMTKSLVRRAMANLLMEAVLPGIAFAEPGGQYKLCVWVRRDLSVKVACARRALVDDLASVAWRLDCIDCMQ